MNLNFKDWKENEIKTIGKRNLLKEINNLSEEEGNFQIVERDDGLVVQWVHLEQGLLRVEKVVNSNEIYFCHLKKEHMDSLINLIFMKSDLSNLPWKKLN